MKEKPCSQEALVELAQAALGVFRRQVGFGVSHKPLTESRRCKQAVDRDTFNFCEAQAFAEMTRFQSFRPPDFRMPMGNSPVCRGERFLVLQLTDREARSQPRKQRGVTWQRAVLLHWPCFFRSLACNIGKEASGFTEFLGGAEWFLEARVAQCSSRFVGGHPWGPHAPFHGTSESALCLSRAVGEHGRV